MTTTEPTPEAVEKLAHTIADEMHDPDWDECMEAARAIHAGGYVHLVTHLNSLTAYERLELGDSLCREAARVDEEEDGR